MRHLHLGIVILALVLASSLAFAGSGEKASPELKLARKYLHLLYDFDFPKLEKIVHEDYVFEDPTSVAFGGQAFVFHGRREAFTFFERMASITREAHLDIDSAFECAGYAVFNLSYHIRVDGAAFGVPGRDIDVSIPGVSIVHVRGGKVVGHVDHLDYGRMYPQINEQLGD